MSRVLVTGGAGMVGAALVKRLLADPAYEVRVADSRPVPQWMREGCEVHTVDLREPAHALAAATGCERVVHLAALSGGPAKLRAKAHSLLDANGSLDRAIVRAAAELRPERLVYVSCGVVFERAEVFPTPEQHLDECRLPASPLARAKLAGEALCRAACEEHDVAFTILRPSGVYGPGAPPGAEPGAGRLVAELLDGALCGQRPLQTPASAQQTLAPTYVEDVAEGIVAALSAAAAREEDFNLSSEQELTVAEIARLAWEACGMDAAELELEERPPAGPQSPRRLLCAAKARRLLGWEARTEPAAGIASTVAWMRGLTVGGGL
ncbi:MAG: NAD-dependent epimerase/dehydratase family protein [Solirubrobacteraceae bacterium]